MRSPKEVPTRCPVADASRLLGQEIRFLLHGKRNHAYKIYFSIEHKSKVVRIFHVRHWAMKALRRAALRALMAEPPAIGKKPKGRQAIGATASLHAHVRRLGAALRRRGRTKFGSLRSDLRSPRRRKAGAFYNPSRTSMNNCGDARKRLAQDTPCALPLWRATFPNPRMRTRTEPTKSHARCDRISLIVDRAWRAADAA